MSLLPGRARLRRSASATLLCAVLLTGCAGGDSSDPIAIVPPGADLRGIAETGPAGGNGLMHAAPERALDIVRRAAADAAGYRLEAELERLRVDGGAVRITRRIEAEAVGGADWFDLRLRIDGERLTVHRRADRMLGIGDDAVLDRFGFWVGGADSRCLAVEDPGWEELLALGRPDALLAALGDAGVLAHPGARFAETGAGPVVELTLAAGAGLLGTLWAAGEGRALPSRVITGDASGRMDAAFEFPAAAVEAAALRFEPRVVCGGR